VQSAEDLLEAWNSFITSLRPRDYQQASVNVGLLCPKAPGALLQRMLVVVSGLSSAGEDLLSIVEL
jgi:hypothetical protein